MTDGGMAFLPNKRYTNVSRLNLMRPTVYPKKYAHGFCFAVLCCGYTLTDVPISIRLTSLALWQSNDCPSTSKATLMNTDKYFMWIPYERLHNHNKAKHNETVCIFLEIYCSEAMWRQRTWPSLGLIAVCRLFGAKSLPVPMLTYSVKGNALENVVCLKMGASLFRYQCVKGFPLWRGSPRWSHDQSIAC